MLKQILLASFFLATFISAGQISLRLEKDMKEASRDFLPVVVEFRTTVNW